MTVLRFRPLFVDVKATVYIVLCLLWGSTWLAIKIGLEDAPPFTTAAIRFLIAVVILIILVAVKGDKYPAGWRRLCSLGYPGLYMYGVSYALVYCAEQYIDSALAAVLFAIFPFFVALLSYVRYRTEKLGRLAWLGMTVGFAGVMLISYDSLSVDGNLFLGTLLAVAAPLAAAYGVVIHKHRHADQSILVAVTVQMIYGGLFLVAGAFLLENPLSVSLTREALSSIIYLALFGTVVTFVGYYWLLKQTSVVTVSMIAFITPLVAITLGTGLAGENLSLPVAIGALMILSGVAVVIRRKGDAS